MKWHYIILMTLAAGMFIWLTWWVLPGKAVLELSPLADGTMPHGAVFGYVSSSSAKGTTKMIRHEEWQHVLEINTGWDAVAAWAPFALLIFIGSATAGCGFGWWVRGNEAELAAENHIKAIKDDIELSKTTMAEAKKLECAVNEAMQRAVKWVNRIEDESDTKIAEAAAEVMAEWGLRLEAEKKLEAERIKHEEEIKKARARISELRTKYKNNKTID